MLTTDSSAAHAGFRLAHDFGFSASATGLQNRDALQRAVEGGGTIVVTEPGIYPLAGMVELGSDTTVIFGAGVIVKKTDEAGPFSHVFVNRGARTRSFNQRIAIHGLNLMVNGVDVRDWSAAFGLHGHLAFFYVKDLRITGFRCYDLSKAQFAIHICSFEDVVVEDVQIRGMKDGVHLGRGKRFTIRDGVFQTFDDAIALNAHDYDVSNPELGWVEDGIVENCHDLDQHDTTGFFCRFPAGGWTHWQQGMEVRKSDTVISAGRLYRLRAEPDGRVYRSLTAPTHETGGRIYDEGLRWEMVQQDPVTTAGVRNVVFRDIFLHKPRTAFSFHFDDDRFSRGYYPGAPLPVQQNFTFENLQVLHGKVMDLMTVATPVDCIRIFRSRLGASRLNFRGSRGVSEFGPTHVSLDACTFAHDGAFDLFANDTPGRRVFLQARSSIILHEGFRPAIRQGGGQIKLDVDLPVAKD